METLNLVNVDNVDNVQYFLADIIPLINWKFFIAVLVFGLFIITWLYLIKFFLFLQLDPTTTEIDCLI